MERMSVDLPQPLGPSRPVIRAASTSRETPSSTVRPPRLTTSWEMEMALTGATSLPAAHGLSATGGRYSVGADSTTDKEEVHARVRRLPQLAREGRAGL